jgi:hypothetical protein
VCGVLGLALLPPEHVHAAAGHDDDAHAEVVHRHFERHAASPPQTHAEDPDEDATYLASVFTIPADETLARPDGDATAADWLLRPVSRLTSWHRQSRDLRVHDPPWGRAHTLRGPPSPLA